MKRTQEELDRMRDLVATAEKMAKNPELILLIGNPDKSCKRCYGVGHIGRDSSTQLYILCSCIFSGEPIWMKKTARRLANAVRKET